MEKKKVQKDLDHPTKFPYVLIYLNVNQDYNNTSSGF